MFVYFNPNPQRNIVGDCVIRAISKLVNKSWDDTFIEICIQGLSMKDMPSSNSVWGEYLIKNDFVRKTLPNTCPDCYSIRDFCEDFPYGKYLVATGTHVVAVENGNYFDTWDSGNEIPIYYFYKED